MADRTKAAAEAVAGNGTDEYRTTTRDERFKGGRLEFLNPTPLQPPIGHKPIPSLFDTIREQIKLHRLAEFDMEPESEDEADDFDIADDPIDPHSPWENDHIPTLKNMKERTAALERQLAQEEQRQAAQQNSQQSNPPPQNAE